MSRGILLLLMAELLFAVATVFVKIISNSSEIPAIEITFFRVAIGTIVAFLYMKSSQMSVRPKKVSLVIWRAILSFSALVAFFYAVQLSTVTKSNMLNMTYPVFVFMVAPLFRIRRLHHVSVVFLILAMAGIYLVILPDFSQVQSGDLIGLLSGIIAAFAIITLSLARQYDATMLIIFYVMAIGTVLNGLLMVPSFVAPTGRELMILIASGITGVIGQVFLTWGYRYLNARVGSMVSSSRIFFAALLGIVFFSEKMTLHIATGGILIMAAIIGISILQKRNHGI